MAVVDKKGMFCLQPLVSFVVNIEWTLGILVIQRQTENSSIVKTLYFKFPVSDSSSAMAAVNQDLRNISR